MNRIIIISCLILFGGTTTFAQRERDERNWERDSRGESKYSYSTVVICYETTNSLSSFVQCLECHKQPTYPLRWKERDIDLCWEKRELRGIRDFPDRSTDFLDKRSVENKREETLFERSTRYH
jgi:hypothetical protein